MFNPECNTRQVYEEGAKQVALSVLSGINCTYALQKQHQLFHQTELQLFSHSFCSLSLFTAASIFAYGQTSSGKTYTMVGITERSMSDIYDYIDEVE